MTSEGATRMATGTSEGPMGLFEAEFTRDMHERLVLVFRARDAEEAEDLADRYRVPDGNWGEASWEEGVEVSPCGPGEDRPVVSLEDTGLPGDAGPRYDYARLVAGSGTEDTRPSILFAQAQAFLAAADLALGRLGSPGSPDPDPTARAVREQVGEAAGRLLRHREAWNLMPEHPAEDNGLGNEWGGWAR